MHQESTKEERKNRALHKDWRTWAVVLLMLLAMATYVLTLDDSTIANGPRANPAAQRPPAPAAP
jgi:hypothetical protein